MPAPAVASSGLKETPSNLSLLSCGTPACGAHESKVPRILLGVEGFQSSPSATAQHRFVSGLTQQLEGARGFLASAELPTEMQRC